jgi:bifunctional DNase/RNase
MSRAAILFVPLLLCAGAGGSVPDVLPDVFYRPALDLVQPADVVLGHDVFATRFVAGAADAGVIVAESKPKGFLEMFVAGVVPSPDGHTLVLVNAEEQVLLPLGIGLTEALSIHGRLEKRRFARPMTHDLLDHIVAELGGSIVRVQIDDLKDDVFVGTVFIKVNEKGSKETKVVSFDARASDAVALAIGARAPIFVARPVVDRAAIHPGDLEDDDGPPSTPLASSPQPSVLSL